MLALSVHKDEIKTFMNNILTTSHYDSFEVRSIVIENLTTFDISCLDLSEKQEQNDKKDEDKKDEKKESQKYLTFIELKPFVLSILKSPVKPSVFKIIFCVRNPEQLHNNAKALFININYYDNDNEKRINITTATSQKNFTLDKSLDHFWDDYIKNFFKSKNINVAEQ